MKSAGSFAAPNRARTFASEQRGYGIAALSVQCLVVTAAPVLLNVTSTQLRFADWKYAFMRPSAAMLPSARTER